MSQPNFITDESFTTLKTIHRVRKVLEREKLGYLRRLHSRCGVGLTIEQFDNIVKQLAATGWCSIRVGDLGATQVVFNQEYYNTHQHSPDEVIADACTQ